MQIVAITDIITHFVGLLHVAPDADRDWSHPDGAGPSAKLDPGPWAHFRSGHTVSDAAAIPTAPMGTPATPESEDRLLQAWKASLHRLAPAAHLHLHPIAPLESVQSQVPSGFSTGDSGSVETSARTYAETYAPSSWLGADQAIVDVHQVNMLIADTAYFDHPAGEPLPIPTGAAIVDMISQAYAPIADHGAPVLGNSDSQEVPILKAYEDALAKGATATAHAILPGTWVDGVHTSSDGSLVPLTLPVASLDFTPPTANGVQLGQTIVTGHDIAGNVALIQDTSAAPLTTIVEGNAYHSDLIIQTNVVHNIDAVATNTPGAFASALSVGGDVVHNTAHFEQLPAVVSTTISGEFAQSWNVQVVNGDFYDVNAVTQQNALINNTLYVGTPQTDHYYAVLGGDTQLNQFEFTHDAPVYDLLIVLGNSYTANAIYQENVLLNDTKAGVAFSPTNDGTDSLIAGHNTVTNDAAIAEFGTTQWNPSTPELQTLVHSLVAEGNSAHGFPGIESLGATVNVMIVTGNYYDLNLISQTNVVSNSSNVLADFTKAGVNVPASLTIGQNTLTNSAAIVSASALNNQYVAGHPYEASMLVQTNLVTANTDTSAASPNALVPELVAFLDPGNVHDVVSGTTPTSTAAPPPTTDAAHHDILGGTLS